MKARWTLLIALLVVFSGIAIVLSFRYDAPLRQSVVESQGKQWKKTDDYKFHSTVRRYGDWPYLMLAGGVGLAVAWGLRNREWQRIIIAAMLASTLAGILANASRLTTGRTRPSASPKIEYGFYGPWKDGRLTVGDRAYNSFPSGHTATAFGFAGVILFASPWIGLGVLVLAGMIACSSVIIGAHHLSDVVVSIVLSLVVAWYVWLWVKRHGDRVARQIQLWLRQRLRRQPSA